MNTNTELYKFFYMVATEKSISKASQKLFVTQPAVSKAIKQLEERTNTSLFFRTAKGVKLTKEGEVLFSFIEKAFNFINLGEKKLEEMKALTDGEITIGVGDTACKHYLVPHLKKFHQKYPGIRIRVTNHTTPIIISMLKKGAVDLGIVNLPCHDNQLNIVQTLQIQDCFIVGEKYSHLAKEAISIHELIKYPMLLLERGSNSRVFLDNYLLENNISIKPEFELGNFELLSQFAQIDFGIACVIRNFVENELNEKKLFEIKLMEPIPSRHLGVAHLNSVPLSSAANKFLSYIFAEI